MLRSYKSTIIAILTSALTIIAGSHHSSFIEALSDFQVQLGIALTILGLLTKDFNVSGPPPDAPAVSIPLSQVPGKPGQLEISGMPKLADQKESK